MASRILATSRSGDLGLLLLVRSWNSRAACLFTGVRAWDCLPERRFELSVVKLDLHSKRTVVPEISYCVQACYRCYIARELSW